MLGRTTTTVGTENAKSTNSPQPLDFTLNKCNLTIRNNCGECLHFKRMAYPAYKKPCIDIGIIETSKPCHAFQTNPDRIKFSESKHARNIAKALADLSPRELKNLAAIINGEERNRRHGFRLGQVVYFRAFGGDYISNYVKAYVISANSMYVHVEGEDGCMASLYHNSVMKQKQWERKELQLLRDNKQRDPNLIKYTRAPTKTEKNIKSIIDKTIATLTTDTKLNSALTVSAKKISKRMVPLYEMDEVISTR